jgi:hypothetical protein
MIVSNDGYIPASVLHVVADSVTIESLFPAKSQPYSERDTTLSDCGLSRQGIDFREVSKGDPSNTSYR